MPYILLIFGLLIGGYALYKFLCRASKAEAQKVLLTLAIGLTVLLVFVMILVGRLSLAAILVAVLIPLVARLYAVFNRSKADE